MERSITNMEEERKSSEEWETIVVERLIEGAGCIENKRKTLRTHCCLPTTSTIEVIAGSTKVEEIAVIFVRQELS
jgi:hypothetical protein